MLRSKRWLVIALTVLAVGATGVVSDAHGRFFRWWLRPPAPAILDSSFTGTAEDGRVKTVVVVNNQVSSFSRTNLEDNTNFTATVTSGAITLNIPQLLDATSLITADVSFPSATLARNFFNSTFFAEGSAVITDNTTTTPTITTVPVFVFGVISQCNGEYKLRADIRGLTSSTDDDGAGTVTDTYTLFKLELEAEGLPNVP